MLHLSMQFATNGEVLIQTYNGNLVLLSIVIAIIAAYSAFYTAERIVSSYHGIAYWSWLFFGSVTMGAGIWTMHFIGMLAMHIDTTVTYDVTITAISIIPAFFASTIVLKAMTKPEPVAPISMWFNALMMGSGIALMHYIGMAAMQLNATMVHHTGLILLSIVLAIALSFVSLKTQANTALNIHSSFRKKILSASIMGAAISSMHYTAMGAVDFIALAIPKAVEPGIDTQTLLISITIMALFILFASILIPYTHRYQELSAQLNIMLHNARAEKNKRIQAIVNSAHDSLIQLNAEGIIIGWSHQAATLSQWSELDIINTPIDKLLTPIAATDNNDYFFNLIEPLLDNETSAIFEAFLIKKDGQRCSVEVAVSAFLVNGNIEFNLFIRDISARKQAEGKLTLFSRIFHAAQEGIIVTDPKGIIIDINPQFCQITGYQRKDVIGFDINLFKAHKEANPSAHSMMYELLTSGVWQGELWYQRKNGTTMPLMMSISTLKNEQKELTNFVCLILDISEITEQKRKLEFMAHYDALTELPNRVLLADRFKQAKSYADRHKTTLAVCFLDIDDFKDINDQYGHQTGDLFLIDVADRIHRVLRESDTVARQVMSLLSYWENCTRKKSVFKHFNESSKPLPHLAILTISA